MNQQPLAWYRILIRVGLRYLPVLILGKIFGLVLEFSLVFLVAQLLWMYHQQSLLLKWLFYQKKLVPPESKGSWEPVFLGVYSLINRRLKRERELAQRLKSFREGAASLPDAVITVDHDGVITWCNKLAEELLNLKWPRDGGYYINQLIRQPKFVNYFQAGNFEKPLELISPIAEQVTLEYRVMPFGRDHKLLMIRDISPLKALESMRRELLSNVSHELRTPLTVIQGYLEMFDDIEAYGQLWPSARHSMLEQSTRMNQLIKQLIELAKIETDEVMVPEVIALDVVCAEISGMAIPLAKPLQQTIEIESIEQAIIGSHQHLSSVLTNLVHNAIKYSSEHSTISLTWEHSAKGLRCCVKDNGPGIAPIHLSRLTERFYRVDDARSRDIGGSGLGLAIVKHALEQFDSYLEIRSTLGKGSSFSFIIPKARLLSKEESQKRLAKSPRHSQAN